jgi:type IV pilus assembly protein PilV
MKLENEHIIDTETPKGTLKQQDGFTLIEVLIALTIFAVGLLAIAAMQTSAIRMNATGNRLTELSTVGIHKFEELMSLPFTNAQLDVGTQTDPVTPDGYTVSWTVVQDAFSANTRRITLTVTRNGKTLRIRSIRCQSL